MCDFWGMVDNKDIILLVEEGEEKFMLGMLNPLKKSVSLLRLTLYFKDIKLLRKEEME